MAFILKGSLCRYGHYVLDFCLDDTLSSLCAKHVIQQERLTKQSFDWLLGEIQSRFERSLAHPGEMAGSIGA